MGNNKPIYSAKKSGRLPEHGTLVTNDFNYKWSKLFAAKRYKSKTGVIKLTPEEQQELLDDAERIIKKELLVHHIPVATP